MRPIKTMTAKIPVLVLAILFSVVAGFGQAVNYGNFYIPGTGDAYLNSSFTNSPGIGQTFENDGDFTVTGNFTNNEIGMNAGSGTIRFSGAVLQQILGTATPVFFNAELNNINNLRQGLNVVVNGSFDLTNGSWQMNDQTLTLSGIIDNIANTGTIGGTSNSELVVGGTGGGNIGSLIFTPGAMQLNNLNMNRSGGGAVATLGSDLNVSGSFNFTSGNFTIGANTLTLAGNLTGTGGSFTGSASSNLTVGGSGSNLGTLNFTSGSQSLNSLSMQRTGVGANAAAVLGTPLTVNAIDLQNGILATGNNLFTWTRTGSLSPVSQTSYTPNTTTYKNSYICLCTSSGAALSFTSPFDASDNIGFRTNNAGTNVWVPIGVDFDAPNRVRINNTGTADNITFLLAKGDIGGTDKPVVRRIWYAYESTPGGTTADMFLYFTKRDPSLFGISQDEIETGFDYTDITLTQKNYGDPNYIDLAQNTDVLSATANANGTELFGQYTISVSPDVNANTDGINQFSRFAVMNIGSFILPVQWLDFTAKSVQRKVELSWIVSQEKNVQSYITERSTDGIIFYPIGTVNALNNGNLTNKYMFTDNQPRQLKNYYRIKVLDKDGSFSYSSTQTLAFESLYKISIAPNPVTGSYLTLFMNELPTANYQLEMRNINGVSVLRQQINHNNPAAAYRIDIPLSIVNGWYILRVYEKGIQNEIPVLLQR